MGSKGKVLLFCAVISFVMLSICSKCSFLYAINDWYDANCFYTVGKGIVNGLVPYRDLYEQKGPAIYFLHALAYLMDGKSMLGVFFLEVVSMAVALYYIYKIARLYLSHERAMLILPLWALVTISSVSFFKGDSVEEFCLPLLAVSLYHLFKYGAREMPGRFVLLAGVMAGCVLWTKFTLLGFWLLWLIPVVLRAGGIRRGIVRLFQFSLGMLIATAPWLLYFGVHGAIFDWLHGYFWINITVYSESGLLNIPGLNSLIGIVVGGAANPIATVFVICGIGWLIKRSGREGRFDEMLALVFLMLGVYIGGNRFPYYHLLTMPYAVFGLIALSFAMDRYGILERMDEKPGIFRRWLFACTAGACLLCAGLSMNIDQMRIWSPRESLPQYRFAKIMHEQEGATMLNYGVLDAGFYTAADILPVNRFFCRLNLDDEDFPEMMKQQNAIIRDAQVDFVVVELPVNENPEGMEVPYLHENYALADQGAINKGIEGMRQYALYQRRGGD